MKKKPYSAFSRAEYETRTEILAFLHDALKKPLSLSDVVIDYPPQRAFGDFSVACFAFSKITGENPKELSARLEKKFLEKGKSFKMLARAKSAGPYLNFFVDRKQYATELLREIGEKKQSFGNSYIGGGSKIMIEYSQPNTHKEFHIGHLRNVCIGTALVHLYRTLGYSVISANYIGDIGAHVAKCLWAYSRFHQNVKPPKNRGKYLGRIYTEAYLKLEEHPEWEKEVQEVLQKLEAGDKKLISLWKKTRQWSLHEFYAIYKKLGAKFDVYFFESEVENPGKKIVSELLHKGIAKKSEGAVIVDLEEYGLKKFLILKSDGSSLYSTKDLALARIKFEKYKIDRSIHIVDARQTLYFQQLFKTLELMGFVKPMLHIPYEFVTLKDSAMSSRLGNIVLYEDFEETVKSKAAEETVKRHSDWKPREIKNVSEKIALAAIKYGMLSHGNGSIITFDPDKAIELSGNTGPYLQYTCARISSIMKKAGKTRLSKTPECAHTLTPYEEEVIFSLAKFPSAIAEAVERNDPLCLTSYLISLAQHFSGFYENVPVLRSEDPEVRRARLTIASAVRTVIAKGLTLLGISPLEKM